MIIVTHVDEFSRTYVESSSLSSTRSKMQDRDLLPDISSLETGKKIEKGETRGGSWNAVYR